MKLRIEIEGDARLARTLLRAANDIESLERAGAQAGRIVRDRASQTAPVDTGYLRSSLSPGVKGDTAWVESSADYAIPVHYGWGQHPGRPFLTDAVQSTESRWMRGYVKEIEDHLGKVKGA